MKAQIAQCMQYCVEEVSRSSSSEELAYEVRHILSGDDRPDNFEIMVLYTPPAIRTWSMIAYFNR